jgi:menaquinone-specific isochorismate synthase
MIFHIQKIKDGLLSFLKENDLSHKSGQFLISFAYKISDIDTDFIIDSVIKENKKVFYFNRSEENLVLLAFKEIFSMKIIGDNRFSNLRIKISDITAGSINNFDKNLNQDFPLFFGGTKFCSVNNSEEWKDFADNDWFIPNFLYYKKNMEEYFIINLLNNDIKEIEPFVNNLFGQLDNLYNTQYHSGAGGHTVSITVNRNEDEFKNWNILVKDALDKIKEGLFRKVVLSRRLVANISNSPLFYLILRQLRNNYGNCNVFLYKSDNAVLFGATPEQLLKFRNKEIEFDALAGSAKRGATIEEDTDFANNLLMDKKNGNEHNHVIEFIKDVSLRYVQDFKQSETGVKKFSNIQHIYTPIKGVLKSKDQIYNLIEDIFPTPAICGSPKDTALKYITDNEKFDRGMFSGIVGFMNCEEMDLSVAIRSALLRQNQLFIYAGCGIVEGSDPLSEYEETEIKMKPILSLFRNEDK